MGNEALCRFFFLLFEEGGSLYLASLDNAFDCCSLFLLFLNVVEVLVAQIRQR